jgi:hypothetical protein
MSPEQLIERISALRSESGEWDVETAAFNLGIDDALGELEEACLKWRDKPVSNGLYWVVGESDPRYLFSLGETWFLSARDEGEISTPLGNRKVCPVLGKPLEPE